MKITKATIPYLKIKEKLYRSIIEPIRKAALYSALHVARARDIELWVMPGYADNTWHASIKAQKGCYQLSADVKILPSDWEPWEDGRKSFCARVSKISFYSFRHEGNLFPLKSDPEKCRKDQ